MVMVLWHCGSPTISRMPLSFVQIYDIETRYLTDANPRGNAVRGEQALTYCTHCATDPGWSRATTPSGSCPKQGG